MCAAYLKLNELFTQPALAKTIISQRSLSHWLIQLVQVHISGLNNHESSDSLSQGIWLFVRGEWLNRVWIECVLSHRVWPLTLALIHLIADEPDWNRCRLGSCQSDTHAPRRTHWLGCLFSCSSLKLSFACRLSCIVNSKSPSLQETLHSLLCLLHTLSP